MKLNETDRKRLGQFLDTLSLTPFRNEMIKRGSLTVSRQTIISELNSLDWEKRRTFYAPPFLTERQKKKKRRLDWCHAHSSFDWEKGFFTDESKEMGKKERNVSL